MAKFWNLATSNAFNTTANGNIAQGDTTINLTSVLGLQAPGILVIDGKDTSGNITPGFREFVSYTGISSTTITGVTRGLGGSSAQSHQSGAVVEEVWTMTHWNDLLTLLLNVFNSTGGLDTNKVADLTTAQTWTNKTLNSPTLVSPINTVVPISGASPTLNLNSGNIFLLAPQTANTTFEVSNAQPGMVFMVIVQQGSGTSYTTAWSGGGFTTLVWETSGAAAPTQTTVSNGYTTYGFICTGSGTFQGFLVGTN